MKAELPLSLTIGLSFCASHCKCALIISYKYRVYPDVIVETRFHEAPDTCRWLYNKLLEECNTVRENRSSLTMQGIRAQIVILKDRNPALKGVYSKMLQIVNYTLRGNIRALSETKKKGWKIGMLRFKSAPRYRMLNYNQSGFKIDCESEFIIFSKIGTIPFRMHWSYSGEVKGVLITRSGDEWYVVIQGEQKISKPRKKGRSVEIDVGLSAFAVNSDGVAIENPRFFERSRARIKRLQQSVARKRCGSKNWVKVKKKLEKAYIHITNQRNDFLHKLSRRYVDSYATICVKDLNIEYLKENDKSRGLRRGVHDVS